MLVLGIMGTLAVIAIIALLIKFQKDLRKRSLVTGVRSPLDHWFYPADLLQHIRETNYVWQEVFPGGYVGVLDRGFGHHFAIAWDSTTSTLTLTDQQDFRFAGIRWFDKKEQHIGEFPLNMRNEVHHEVVHHLRLQQAAGTTGDDLPRAQARE